MAENTTTDRHKYLYVKTTLTESFQQCASHNALLWEVRDLVWGMVEHIKHERRNRQNKSEKLPNTREVFAAQDEGVDEAAFIAFGLPTKLGKQKIPISNRKRSRNDKEYVENITENVDAGDKVTVPHPPLELSRPKWNKKRGSKRPVEQVKPIHPSFNEPFIPRHS
jgi:hypothetical protein